MRYEYKPQGVCAGQISFDLNDGIVTNVKFIGGCNGNLNAISKLVEGKDADYIVDTLLGNDCGGRGTSCADQFARALQEAVKAESEES